MNQSSENSPLFDEVRQQLRSGSDMPSELQAIFAQESEDHLRTIEEGFARLAENSNDLEPLGEIRRAAHTLKGAAGAVDLKIAASLSHRMEDLLDELVQRGNPLSDSQTSLLQVTSDLLQEVTAGTTDIEEMTNRICTVYESYDSILGKREADPPAQPQVSRTIETSPPVANQPNHSAECQGPRLRVPLSRLDELVGGLGEMVVAQSQFQHRLNELD